MLPLGKVFNEIENFKDVLRILACSVEYFTDCTTAYNATQRRSERDAFTAQEFRKLNYLVHRCRLLINTIDEEYRIYEDSFERKKKPIRPARHEKKMAKGSAFQRLSSVPHDKFDHKTDDDTEDIDEEKDLEKLITTNLHKILPQKNGSKPATAIEIRYKTQNICRRRVADRPRREVDEISGNIHILETCLQSKSSAMRVDVITMLREMRNEYNVESGKKEVKKKSYLYSN